MKEWKEKIEISKEAAEALEEVDKYFKSIGISAIKISDKSMHYNGRIQFVCAGYLQYLKDYHNLTDGQKLTIQLWIEEM